MSLSHALDGRATRIIIKFRPASRSGRDDT